MRHMDYSTKYFSRDILAEELTEMGKLDKRIVVVNADLMGSCRNRSFVEAFPNRSFNVGIAEQNMVSFSAGLAHEGFIPYAFSMAPFTSMRACEQCRTDVAYANIPVRLVSPYSGLSGGISGATHWGMEDVAIMAAMPNMIVMEPCDPVQARLMIRETLNVLNPVYIRNSVEPIYRIYPEDYKFEIGKASIAKDGKDGAFICSGITVKYAVEAADRIEMETGKTIRVVDIHTVKPLDKQAIIDAAATGNIVVAQDHIVIGGIGSMVATVLLENNCRCRFKNVGIPDKYLTMAHAPYLYHELGYDTDGLYKKMMELVGE